MEDEEFLNKFDLIVVTEVDAPTLVSTTSSLVHVSLLATDVEVMIDKIEYSNEKIRKETFRCYFYWN